MRFGTRLEAQMERNFEQVRSAQNANVQYKAHRNFNETKLERAEERVTSVFLVRITLMSKTVENELQHNCSRTFMHSGLQMVRTFYLELPVVKFMFMIHKETIV